MFEKSSTARHKNEHRVFVTLAGQERFEAYVFLRVNERLIDLLNDARLFIPVKQADGATLIVSKQNIVSIIERPGEPEASLEAPTETAEPATEHAKSDEPPHDAPNESANPERDKPEADETGAKDRDHRFKRGKKRFDPYEILRIAKEAGPEEIRKAYHARMKQVHPDAIAALDLDEDLARAANISAQRVNRAYRILMREKHEAAKPEETAA